MEDCLPGCRLQPGRHLFHLNGKSALVVVYIGAVLFKLKGVYLVVVYIGTVLFKLKGVCLVVVYIGRQSCLNWKGTVPGCRLQPGRHLFHLNGKGTVPGCSLHWAVLFKLKLICLVVVYIGTVLFKWKGVCLVVDYIGRQSCLNWKGSAWL